MILNGQPKRSRREAFLLGEPVRPAEPTRVFELVSVNKRPAPPLVVAGSKRLSKRW